jgi:MoaD family protein
MKIRVHFWSYFKDLAGSADMEFQIDDGATVGTLLKDIHGRYPKLAAAAKSTLIAVGVDYQTSEHQLKDGDEVSLFPPVSGG